MRLFQRVAKIGLCMLATAILSSSASAQCSTVPLVVNGIPNTSFQVLTPNNTLCMFGGNLNGVRGIVSCIATATPFTTSSTTSYQGLLAWLEAKMPLTVGQISQITNNVDYAFISYVDNTVAQNVEAIFLNKSELLSYVNNGYPLVGVGRGTYRANIAGSLKRIAFSPVVRNPGTVADVLTEAFISGSYFSFVGYDRAVPSNRFNIYRLTPSSAPTNFGAVTVCTGQTASAYNDFFHQFSETVSPMSTLNGGRRFIHVD